MIQTMIWNWRAYEGNSLNKDSIQDLNSWQIVFYNPVFIKRGALTFKAGNETKVCSNSNESYLPGISYVHSSVNGAAQVFY